MSAGERPDGDRPVDADDLAAFVDERLPDGRADLVRQVLADRPAVAAHLQADREIQAALRDRLAGVAAEPVPARLRVGTILAAGRWRRRRLVAFAAASCILLLAGGVAGWAARGFLGGVPSAPQGRWAAVAGEALAAHRTFAVEIVHPVEVKAAEEDHMKRWLSKRLGRQLVVPDLEPYGMELVGGRLLPAGRQVAALLMYADQAGSRLTVYVRSGEPGESALRFMREGELSSFTWMDRGYGYVVSAAMDRERLQNVARTISQEVDLEGARRSPHL